MSFVLMCFLYPIGVSEALSAPPAITTSACPVANSPIAATMALFAEIHACVTVWHGVLLEIPAVSAASLAKLLVFRV